MGLFMAMKIPEKIQQKKRKIKLRLKYKKRVERKITMQTQTQNVQTQTVDRLGRTAQNHWVASLRWANHESDYAPNGHENI